MPLSTKLGRFFRTLADPGRGRISQRVAVVTAHPDDEVIGLGAQLNRFEHLLFIHITDGAPANMKDAIAMGFTNPGSYAAERRREFEQALKVARICPEGTHCLRVPDQEAPFFLAPTTRVLEDHLRKFRPEMVFTHPYEGGHPDHDACAFCVHAACRRIQERCMVMEMTSYHCNEGRFVTGSFLPSDQPLSIATLSLDPTEQALKQSLFSCYQTQKEVLKLFPIQSERFRKAPVYDFTQPPQCDQLHYEGQDWGISGDAFRLLVRRAKRILE